MEMSEAPVTRSRRGAASRQRVLNAAATLFSRRGYAATAMRDIARSAELKVSAIYYHFPSKEDLLLAVEKEAFTQLSERVLKNVERQNEPWARLQAACRAHLEGVLNNREYVDVTSRELPRDHSAKIRQQIRQLRESYENIFRDLVMELPLDPKVNTSMLRLTLLGAMAWSLVWYRADRGSPEQVADEIMRILRYGVE